MKRLVPLALVLVAGCGGARSGAHDHGADGSVPPAGDGSSNDAQDLGASSSCPPVTDVPPAAAAAPLASYPALRYAALGALGARVKTACVDVSALASHARLPALATSWIAAAGLSSSAPGCGCDYTIAFASAPPSLSGAAASAWAAAGSNAERYLVVADSAAGRASATLYAENELAASWALRAALDLVQPDKSQAGAHRVAAATLVDYPAFAARGVVEGIYGPTQYCDTATMTWLPWNPGERAVTLELMSRLRENTFIYGPKCDPYTRAHWDVPYPAGSSDEAVLRVALHDAESRLLKFVWSIAPGNSYNFGAPAADFAKLTAKIESMRKLGVTHFALFLDDIPDHSAPPQVALINALEDYIRKAAPAEHLIVVGTTYCSNPNNTFNCGGPNAYTDAMGQGVRPEVEIMWTGADVEPSTMSAGDMTAINKSLRRKVVIWDNWPNATGSFTGRSADLPSAVAGYYSNPVLNEFPGPANPAWQFYAVLGPIADYLWNPAPYVKNESGSFSTWQGLRGGVAGASANDCTPCGADAPGWTCSPDKTAIEYCDLRKPCLSAHVCPAGCQLQPNPKPDLCN